MHSCALCKNNFTHWEVMIPINMDSVHILHRKRIHEISGEFTFSSSQLKRTFHMNLSDASLNASRPRAKSHCFIEACRNTRSLNLQLLVLRIRIINCTDSPDRSFKKKQTPSLIFHKDKVDQPAVMVHVVLSSTHSWPKSRHQKNDQRY